MWPCDVRPLVMLASLLALLLLIPACRLSIHRSGGTSQTSPTTMEPRAKPQP